MKYFPHAFPAAFCCLSLEVGSTGNLAQPVGFDRKKVEPGTSIRLN
jgi:hypothetical protein